MNMVSNSVAQNIEFSVFPTPSGNVRGYVTAFLPGKKGSVRIAHAFLLTDAPAEISLSLSKRLTPDETLFASQVLAAYVDKVRELDAPVLGP